MKTTRTAASIRPQPEAVFTPVSGQGPSGGGRSGCLLDPPIDDAGEAVQVMHHVADLIWRGGVVAGELDRGHNAPFPEEQDECGCTGIAIARVLHAVALANRCDLHPSRQG